MNQLCIKDPTLKRLLIEHMVEQIDGGGIDHLLHAGYSPEFLDDLRHRPTRDFIFLAQTAIEVRFSLSEDGVNRGLRLLDMQRGDAELREYFIVHGASRRMVCSYFKLSHDEYRTLREVLRPGDGIGGRTPMPPPDVRDEIHSAWFDIQKTKQDAPIRQRIYELHQQFVNLRISALQQTIAEFSESADSELEFDPAQE